MPGPVRGEWGWGTRVALLRLRGFKEAGPGQRCPWVWGKGCIRAC